MACINVVAADTDEEANHLATSFYQLALGLFRNDRRPLPPPVDKMDDIWTDREKLGVMQMRAYAFIGNGPTIASGLQAFLDKTQVDEVMITSHIFDFNARLKSLELTAAVFKG